jgi:hypothetical protein
MGSKRVGVGEVWMWGWALVAARRGGRAQGSVHRQGTAGSHKGPRTAPDRPCPYAIF